MSILVLFAIGFAGACGLGATGAGWGWLAGVMAVCLCGFTACLVYRKRLAVLGMAAVVLAGCFAGCGWNLLFRAVYLDAAIAADGATEKLSIRAADYSEPSNYGSTVDGVVMLDGKPYQIRAYLNGDRSLKPGDEIHGEFRLRVTTFGGADDATHHGGKGIFLLAYQKGVGSVTECEKVPWWCFPAVLRERIKDVLDGAFSEDAAAFARALLLGDGSKLSYAVDTAFKVSGIRHIIAVSGLHVSILYGFLSTITMKRRYLTLLVGSSVLLLFAAVAGFTPSVTRACIMVGLMMAAQAFGRDYDPPTALAAAVVIMLLANPLTITNAGFQLSVASVAGIYLFAKPIKAWLMKWLGRGKGILGKLGSGIASSVGVSLGATLLTTPLSAWYFGCVSLAAVLTNLLTLWMVSLIFYGLIAICVLSLFWAGGVSAVAWVVRLPIWAVLGISGFIAGIPMTAVYTQSVYIAAWLVFVYLLPAVYLLSEKKRPLLLCCCAVLGLCLAQTVSFVEPLTDECRVTVLDVGQGQCILLQGQGRNYLVDCGGDSDEAAADLAAASLLSQGVTRLDGIIVTHGDRDHAGGVGNLLKRVGTDLLLLPGFGGPGMAEELTGNTDAAVVYVTEDQVLTCGDMRITVYGPIFPEDSNENSLCVLFSTENCDILITGDRSGVGERSLLRRVELPEVDVLIAGHHGSKYSTSEELLEAVQPEIVVISVGENHYGHPSQETLERIREYTDEIYRTDLNGTVVFRR